MTEIPNSKRESWFGKSDELGIFIHLRHFRSLKAF
jgi:hypothetical protein